MKGNAKIIATLNVALAEELTAVNQYMVHAEMAESWGYGKLAKLVKTRAISEMKHAEKLIERILFLEGTPVVSQLNKINIGADVPQQLANDLALEMDAIATYNRGIKETTDAGDNATKMLFEVILKDEDRDVDVIEEKLDQIKQMGIEHFLALHAGD